MGLALLGHDLRAALAEVQSGLALIQRQEVPEALLDSFGRCRAAGETLAQLIDKAILVCLGRADPGLGEAQPFDFAAFLASFRQRWQGRAAETGHSLTIEVFGKAPGRLTLDRTALDRILSNLVGNALRHTPSGPIMLTAKFAGDGLMLFVVSDTGPGFAPHLLPHLEKSLALPEDLRRLGGGFGLLSVKSLVEQMGGTANARNRASGGAEIGICLPLREADSPNGPDATPVPNLSGLRFVMADDSASSRELVSLLARQTGATVDAFANASEAQSALRADCPDLLILDAEMPGVSGIDLLSWLRRQPPPLGSLPVLALTSHIDEAAIARLGVTGAQGVLAKPVLCPIELGRAVLSAMANRHQPRPFDLAPLRRLRSLAGDAQAAELFARFEEDLANARAGLRRAASIGDLPALRSHSHVVIALAGTAGAEALHNEALTLNEMAHAGAAPDRIAALALAIDTGLEQLAQAVRREAQSPPPDA